FAHPATDHWTGSRACGVNEIGDPDLAGQLRGTERLPILIHKLKSWNCSVGRNSSLPEGLYFYVTQPKPQLLSYNWNQIQNSLPRNAAAYRRLIPCTRRCVHDFLGMWLA